MDAARSRGIRRFHGESNGQHMLSSLLVHRRRRSRF
ncbi:hypothetical protein ACP70R_016023 [Stipagrostis hirtigluma subsp. patula]